MKGQVPVSREVAGSPDDGSKPFSVLAQGTTWTRALSHRACLCKQQQGRARLSVQQQFCRSRAGTCPPQVPQGEKPLVPAMDKVLQGSPSPHIYRWLAEALSFIQTQA